MDNSKKILWVHNFQLGADKGGVWMFNQHKLLEAEVDLYYADGLRNPFNLIKHFFRLKRMAVNYDILHAQYGSMVGLLTGLMPNKKLLSIKGSDWYLTKTKNLKDVPRIWIGYLSTRITLKFLIKDIVVMSKRTKLEIESFNKNLNINVLVDPIDLTKFYPKKTDKKAVKNVLFASVKIDNPVKRYLLAKNSFDLLYKRNLNVNWYVMNNVKHEDVNDFINEADVILLTSTHEGWPNVIKECLACNVPFVSTDVSDLKEIAQQTNNCFVVDEAKPELLATALQKALQQGKNENLRKFVEDFDMRFFKEKLFSIYKGLKE